MPVPAHWHISTGDDMPVMSHVSEWCCASKKRDWNLFCRLFLPLNTPRRPSACVTQGKFSGSELLRPFVSHREAQQSVAEWTPPRVPAVLYLSVGGSQWWVVHLQTSERSPGTRSFLGAPVPAAIASHRLTYRSWSSSVAKVILRTPCARVSNAELSCSISNGPLADHPPSVTEPYCKHLPSQWARLAVFCLLNTTGKASESHQRARGLCNAGIWPKRALRGLIYPGTTGVEAVQEPRGDWRGCAVLLCSSGLSGCWKNHKGWMRGCRWCDKKSVIAVVKWWVCGQWVREGMVDGALRSSHLRF